MQPFVETEKPTIKVHVTKDVSRSILNQVLFGIEEEGIPFEVIECTEMDIIETAYDAAQCSRLDVGVGIDSRSAVLHFAKLPKSNPLFEISYDGSAQSKRAIGSNAGRLVKKLPLKIID